MKRTMDENNLWGTLHINITYVFLITLVFFESLGRSS
jgi:hypothetical protein